MTVVEVTAWHDALGRVAGLPHRDGALPPEVARFRDIDARIEQPALDADVLAIHLGGAKRVIRRQGCRTLEVDVPPSSFTIMPAFEAFRWETFGPIDFAHLAIDGRDLRRVAAEDLGGDPDRIRLEPVVGGVDPAVTRLFQAVLGEARRPGRGRLYRDALAAALSFALLSRHADRRLDAVARRCGRGKLATWRLRRVIDYMRAHLAEDIALDTLVGLTSLGRAGFFRAFKVSMGRTPFAHLRDLRLLEARRLLIGTDLPVTAVAAAVGLEPTRLAAAFRRAYDTTPRAFRAESRP